MSEFPIAQVRAEFPALLNEDDFIFLDNAAGAQSPCAVLDAVAHHLLHRNVQRGGRYRHSVEVDEAIAAARASLALLVNARHPEERSEEGRVGEECRSRWGPCHLKKKMELQRRFDRDRKRTSLWDHSRGASRR